MDLAVNPVPANVIDASLLSAEEVDSYSFTISDVLGSGSLTIDLTATTGSLIPRLTLSGPLGELLIQSDSGRIVQHLRPGDYSISVSAQLGLGGYQLTTGFTVAGPPLSSLRVGTLPHSVAVSDFNRDGHGDVVATNLLDATVSVMLGNGDGTFQSQRVLGVGGRPISVTVADVDGNGRSDVIVVNKDDDSVGVLLGNGDGTFQPFAQFAVGDVPGAVAVSDLNGDGDLDLAVSNYGDATVSVLLGAGDGTFQAQQPFATGAGPVTVETADLDGDGVPDLITANYLDNSVSVLLGIGDGSFTPRQTLAAGAGPKSMKVADLNGDGRPDIAVTNYSDSTVSVLLGNDDGSFQPQQTFDGGAGAYSMEVADVNGDGQVDVLTVSFSDNRVYVLLGAGDGTLSEPIAFAAGRGAGSIAAADLDGDGRPDIVTADFTDNAVSVLLGRGDGTFAIQSVPAQVPDVRVYSIAVADLNGDGRPDIVTDNKGDNNVSVLLLNADGSFQTRQTFATGTTPSAAVIADIDGDGVPDIITASYTENTASILLGRGDGTFEAPLPFDTGSSTYYQLSAADVNGDGRPDIVTANNDATVSVLLNETRNIHEPSFQSPRVFDLDRAATSVTVGDVNGDDLPDILGANGGLILLLGNGDGSFQPFQSLEVNGPAFWVLVDDVNRDGIDDIVTTNSGSDSVSVLLGEGGGTFRPHRDFATGDFSGATVSQDVTGDDIPDLITAGIRAGTGSLLVGIGDGTFEPPLFFPIGTDNSGIEVADFNGDMLLDLAQGNFQNDAVTIVHGNSDGTFDPPEVIKLRKNRYSVAVADVNGDGKPDAIQTNLRQDSVSVRLGTGTGSFEPGETLEVGSQPTSVRVADFNSDGRVDLVATNSDGDSVSVLLGNGDGTFNEQQSFAVGRSPRTVVVADVDGDGVLDLAVANYNDGSMSVLLGNEDGSFREQQSFAVGQRPYSLTVADINGDGQLDLVAANSADNTISVLLGNGDGSFTPQQTVATGQQPFDVTVADVNDDHFPDVITANAFDNTVSVLLGNGDGSFRAATSFATGQQPSSVTAVDLDGDGQFDLVTANFGDDTTSVLLGNGDGTFQGQQSNASHLLPTLTVAADINSDGRPDLITVGNHDDTTGVLLNTGRGEFQPATAATDVGLRDTPFLADINDDGRVDRVILDRAGRIQFRAGLASSTFAPPITLNPDRPARDITMLRRGSETLIAAADTRFDPDLSTSQFVFTVSLYGVEAGGAISRRVAISTAALPSRIAAEDITGDGLADLIVANTLDNSISIAVRNLSGDFADPITVVTGNAPSDIAVADVNADGRPDVLVSNQGSGDVSVVLNDAAHSFSESLRFRAGTQPYSLDSAADSPLVSSLAESVSLVAGDFTADPPQADNDVVVVNRGAHSFTVLTGNGRGGFANPQVIRTTSTSDGFDINERPGELVAGDFNRDGRLDLTVLMEDTGELWIFTRQADGSFDHTFSIPVGDQATGLSVIPGSGDGLLDLLVGNGFGDVLHLEGKGDGTFQIQGNRVSLSVVPDLFGTGQAGVLVGNQQGNSVTVQASNSGGTSFNTVATLGADNDSQLAPGDVQWSLLARNATIPDAVVVSTGGNAVIVYHTTAITNGVPIFAPDPQTYFVGSAPASVTVADLNSDSIPDMLVANKGSNDVSVLFGSYGSDGAWIGNAGPRLHSGGAGPIAVAVRDLNGDLIPDLAVTNGSSGTVTLLIGVGQGFFDDRQPQTLFNLGGAVDQPPTFTGESGVGFAVTTTGNLVRFDLSDPNNGANVVFSGNQVVAARALSNGQVVVASADGTVNVLSPQGNHLIVSAELRAQSGRLVSPSSLVVVQQASGQFQVLVSSQGSNTVSVFAAAAAVQPIQFFIPIPVNNSQSSASFNAAFTNFSTLLTSNSFSGSSSATTGISLSNFLSGNNLVFTATSSAALVAVAGNTYSTVAVLDFGAQRDDDAGDGRGRMPWLSIRYPVGDRSPLAQFVIGIKEAINEYRGDTTETPASRDDGAPRNDPWNVNMFQRTRPARTPTRTLNPKTPAAGESKKTDGLNAPRTPPKPEADADEQSAIDAFWRQCPEVDSPLLAPAAVARGGFRFDLGAMILAGVLFAQHPKLDSARDDKHWTPRSRQ